MFLSDLLRGHRYTFPKGLNPSVSAIEDRFMLDKHHAQSVRKEALKIFEALAPLHGLSQESQRILSISAYLLSIGRILNFYHASSHGSYILLNALEYGFSHAERVSICLLIEYSGKKIPKNNYTRYVGNFGLELVNLQWLSFMLALAGVLCRSEEELQIRYEYIKTGSLRIFANADLYLAKEVIGKLYKPEAFHIEFV